MLDSQDTVDDAELAEASCPCANKAFNVPLASRSVPSPMMCAGSMRGFDACATVSWGDARRSGHFGQTNVRLDLTAHPRRIQALPA